MRYDKSHGNNVQEVIYHALFPNYLKTLIYRIVCIISIHKKSYNSSIKLIKNIDLILFVKFY